ncbi:DUF3105 domain-containing protein [Streptomyces pluripotens]|uniref:DUF3105 domain-containing protein n=1 Tax=Streptomyces pluripotens TaxID=1355015 RepID=A0A221NW50_9ACTN|nr:MULTISPECIES: DUF3105 domain-containing protein [Streptomyces]ARP69941.1 hypothetical protein LK06_008145 [Streptomyces pluripotens]ASN24197.1 DUF3105 domain-containing protein [Streptomyces pluripotens]KIE24859.1 membrane protein [Streptomyces sp. MUSC 125]MCH0555541.1 DUF3105 domain-containing protein [Streptomyces sp. MUM 16J]
MGSAENSRSAARTAHIEEMRRAERARRRRNRVLIIAASAVAVVGLVAGGVVLLGSRPNDSNSSNSSNSKDTASDAKAPGSPGDSGDSGHFVTGKDGVRTWSGKLSRNHVTTKVSYPMHPPVGGNHNPVWADCNGTVYTKPLRDENAVHSLEHGAVWVTYTSKAQKADVDALAAKVRRTPYSMMSPYENQAGPLVLSAWGRQVSVKSATDPEVDRFFAAYVQGAQTPEPGAPCSAGEMK